MDIKKVLMQRIEAVIDPLIEEIRREIAVEIVTALSSREIVDTPAPGIPAFVGAAVAVLPTPGPGRGGKIRQCIATGCDTQSKGPRFHYLCEAHKDAKPRQLSNWRKSRAEMGMDD